jgi:Na+-translocating ferredoxin:NAD+ oxidoreductase subunit E
MKENKLKILTNGFIKENPVLVLILGTCPTLAVSTQAINGLGMGISATIVLVFSNIFISALKRVIPDKVRIPCYIVVIAVFVTIVQLLLKAYLPALDKALGLFIPLIVVNCIILGRAEMYANKNSVVNSALDGLGMGIGFTLALTAMACIRELLGSGSIFGVILTANLIDPMSIFVLAPGGFFTFGCMIAAVNKITKGKAREKAKNGCMGCPAAAACGQAREGGCQ